MPTNGVGAVGAPSGLGQWFEAHRQGCPFAHVRHKLRAVGLRPTRQRVSLGLLLFGNGDRHVTAEVLHEEAVRARVPVSLATVYNTLHQFTEAGLLRQLAADGSKTYFDTNTTAHHHFLIDGEGTLVDAPPEAVTVGGVAPPPDGYEIASVEVIVRLRPTKPLEPTSPEPWPSHPEADVLPSPAASV